MFIILIQRGYTALMMASEMDDVTIVEALLQHGAEVCLQTPVSCKHTTGSCFILYSRINT